MKFDDAVALGVGDLHRAEPEPLGVVPVVEEIWRAVLVDGIGHAATTPVQNEQVFRVADTDEEEFASEVVNIIDVEPVDPDRVDGCVVVLGRAPLPDYSLG
ncbi:hypothetical protein [Haloarcula litorea]|uniref:hypothetical protein n=1 Tax=Haloarcula litorea TaxID=3032579 RepID=UPI0023E7AC69|nr:hypothetical protein [Halomicroarcula sp. GDY20]